MYLFLYPTPLPPLYLSIHDTNRYIVESTLIVLLRPFYSFLGKIPALLSDYGGMALSPPYRKIPKFGNWCAPKKTFVKQ